MHSSGDSKDGECPQCTWFVETNLPAGGAAWPADAELTVLQTGNTTKFLLLSGAEKNTRKMFLRERIGGSLPGAVRLEFHKITSDPKPTPRKVKLKTDMVAGVTIHTVEL